MKAYIIHSSSCIERKEVVDQLIQKTGGEIVEAVMLPNRVEGCLRSHLKVAQIAKEKEPTEPYMVFEDDCILEDGWDAILSQSQYADFLFFGYTEASRDTIFGTHALWINPKLRDLFLEKGEEYAFKVRFPWAADWVIPKLCQDYKLNVFRPAYDLREKWAYQKKGLKSQITGKIRI